MGLRLLWVFLPSLLFACGSDERGQVWGDVFDEGLPTLLTDSAFTALQNTMRSFDNGPWRVTGVRSSARFLWLPSHGKAVAESVMGVPRAVLETPYWTGWFRIHGAVGEGYTLAATNLLYPIRIFDQEGLLRDSLTAPPPSWVQARRPAQGEFMPEEREEIREYRQSHTIITGLAAVSEHVFIVAHGRYELDCGDFDGPTLGSTTGKDGAGEQRRKTRRKPTPAGKDGCRSAFSQTEYGRMRFDHQFSLKTGTGFSGALSNGATRNCPPSRLRPQAPGAPRA